MNAPIRILIADDHALLRRGLATLLKCQDGFTVVGEATNGREAVDMADELSPDVIVMDLSMPVLNGVEATRKIHARRPDVRILILTTFGTSDGISHALKAGAKGAVMKNCDFNELVTAIRTVATGKEYISPEVQRIMSKDPPVASLSPRQEEILQSIIRGLSNPDIAKQLGISLDMVKEHIETLFQKIGAANRSEAVAIALRKHLLKI